MCMCVCVLEETQLSVKLEPVEDRYGGGCGFGALDLIPSLNCCGVLTDNTRFGGLMDDNSILAWVTGELNEIMYMGKLGEGIKDCTGARYCHPSVLESMGKCLETR